MVGRKKQEQQKPINNVAHLSDPKRFKLVREFYIRNPDGDITWG